MGVWVDETRKHAAAVGFENFIGPGKGPVVLRSVTDEGDLAAVTADDCPRSQFEFLELKTPPRAAAGRCDDLVGASDEEAHP